MPDQSLSELINAVKGLTPWHSYWKSLAEYVNQNTDDIALISVGSPLGWGSALDTRWYVGTTGTNTYSATPTPAPGGADAIPMGFSLRVNFLNSNTSTTCTLDLGSTEGAEPIKVLGNDGTVQDPPVGYLSGMMFVIYDSTNNRYIAFSARMSGTAYESGSSNKTLNANTNYTCLAAADRSHTLPLKSTLSAGDSGRVSAGASGVKIIKHNAADSSGAPVYVLFQKGDWYAWEYDGTNFNKVGGQFTGRIRLHLTGSNSIGGNNNAKVFNANYSEDEDTPDQWDQVTNHRYDHPAAWPDCRIRVSGTKLSDHAAVILGAKLNGTQIWGGLTAVSGAEYQPVNFVFETITASDYFELWAWNDNSSTRNLLGPSTQDRTSVIIEIEEWLP